jgi:hypothetical protein
MPDPLGDHLLINQDGTNMPVHRECMLRTVMGGIGHLTDHAFWCNGQGDPDMGLSFRESALAVDQWVHDQAKGSPDASRP